MRTTRMTVAALALALPLSLAACGSSDSGSGASSSDTMTSSAPSTSPSESMAMGDQPFGAACSAVPTSGAGSFDGMAKDPVATAASNNPVLSTLVTAVGKAGLGETLNTTQDITVFAPTSTTPSWQRNLVPSPIQTKRPKRIVPRLPIWSSRSLPKKTGPSVSQRQPAGVRKRRQR